MMIRSWGDQMESVVIYGQQKIAQRNIWIHKKKTSIGGDGDDMFFGWKKQKKSLAVGFSMVFVFPIGVFHTPKDTLFGW